METTSRKLAHLCSACNILAHERCRLVSGSDSDINVRRSDVFTYIRALDVNDDAAFFAGGRAGYIDIYGPRGSPSVMRMANGRRSNIQRSVDV